jgi:CRISPR-associated protein (TIGR03984 family)
MKIDYEKIKTAFRGAAWSYAEQYDGVKIGKWTGESFLFYEPLDEEYLLSLRVFDENRELKFSGDKCRDTTDYAPGDYISELADAKYYMYGEHDARKKNEESKEGFTPLWEDRGATLYFPARLEFPSGQVGLKLGVKRFVRYNPIRVLPKGKDCDCDIDASGAGAIEVADYAYTGFYYAYDDGKAVEL